MVSPWEMKIPVNCLFIKWKWAYTTDFGPWWWSAPNMDFVDRDNLKRKETKRGRLFFSKSDKTGSNSRSDVKFISGGCPRLAGPGLILAEISISPRRSSCSAGEVTRRPPRIHKRRNKKSSLLGGQTPVFGDDEIGSSVLWRVPAATILLVHGLSAQVLIGNVDRLSACTSPHSRRLQIISRILPRVLAVFIGMGSENPPHFLWEVRHTQKCPGGKFTYTRVFQMVFRSTLRSWRRS